MSALLLLASLIASPAVRAAPAISERPTYVVDGDTLRFRSVRVRIHGIQAPELRRCDGTANPEGSAAKAALAALVSEGPIQCFDMGQRPSYGRPVLKCFNSTGQDLGAAMVASGWAWDFARFSERKYAVAELAARAGGRGLFSDGRRFRPMDASCTRQ